MPLAFPNRRFSAALACLIFLAVAPAAESRERRVTVKTETGPITGTREGDLAVFRGIPYAEPPLGERRFRPPEPIAPWGRSLGRRGREAFEFGPACMQATDYYAAFSEDCLTLNIWAPKRAVRHARRSADRRPDRRPGRRPGRGRPVMVWIHGGGFTEESGQDPWYDGASLARKGGVIIVTLNYRLGAFGFLSVADRGGPEYAGSANAGILDSIAALRWIQENIAAFGGDPDRVTIFGESAGGISVSAMLGAPQARGLFRRAISMSGAASPIRSADYAKIVTDRLMQLAGVASFDELKALSTEELAAADEALQYDVFFSDLLYGPTIDGAVFSEAPLHSIQNGSAEGVELMIGTTRDEVRYYIQFFPGLATLPPVLFAVFNSYLLDLFGGHEDMPGALVRLDAALADYASRRPATATPSDLGLEIGTDIFFQLPAVRLAEAQTGHSRNVWMYLFTWPTPILGGVLGAAHGVDTPFVFGNLEVAAGLIGDDPPRELVGIVQDAVLRFAWTGNPNARRGDTPHWPRYHQDRATLLLDVQPEVQYDPDSEDFEYWADVPFDGVTPRARDLR